MKRNRFDNTVACKRNISKVKGKTLVFLVHYCCVNVPSVYSLILHSYVGTGLYIVCEMKVCRELKSWLMRSWLLGQKGNSFFSPQLHLSLKHANVSPVHFSSSSYYFSSPKQHVHCWDKLHPTLAENIPLSSSLLLSFNRPVKKPLKTLRTCSVWGLINFVQVFMYWREGN